MASGKSLVVGASGLVGGALMRVLRRAQIDVAGTYAKNPRPGLEPLDITYSARVRACVERHRPAVIFLTGALTHVDYCEEHADEAFAINVEGPRAVAEAARAAGARLVFYSTEYVFDGNAGPYDEEEPPSPLSVYGRSKLAAERAILETLDDALVLRTTVVYGWDAESKNFAMQVYQKVRVGERMTIPADQFGNPTLAEYLAEASVALVRQDARGVVNAVGKDLVARSDFALALVKLFGGSPDLIVPVTTDSLKQKAPRPLRGGLKPAKLERLLGRDAIPLGIALKRLDDQRRAEEAGA